MCPKTSTYFLESAQEDTDSLGQQEKSNGIGVSGTCLGQGSPRKFTLA